MIDKPNAQPDKFADLARELECDDDEAAFDAKLREIAKHKPADASATVPSEIPEGGKR